MKEEDGFNLFFTIQVDTVCHKIPRFIEKAGRAGVNKAFIGLETINSDSLKGAGKKQNNITDYRILLQSLHKAGILTFAGYILGFPGDTPEKTIRDVATIQRELPVDLLEFFILTPLPGSRDHKSLIEQGITLDTDM
ncbi:MAG: radical SAM protein, partial [bacterium]|nr:radical SAM protein [bacterium]